MKIPKYLRQFDNGDLVNYRYLDCEWQIHDVTLNHIGFTMTEEMARLICDSINLAYKISKVYGEK